MFGAGAENKGLGPKPGKATRTRANDATRRAARDAVRHAAGLPVM
jgi:hypothetical protein